MMARGMNGGTPPPPAGVEGKAAALTFYDADYVEHIAGVARAFLLARDAYVGAWLAWRETPLGAADGDPRDEAAVMESIFKAALESRAIDEAGTT
jgi:hypothetical protein